MLSCWSSRRQAAIGRIAGTSRGSGRRLLAVRPGNVRLAAELSALDELPHEERGQPFQQIPGAPEERERKSEAGRQTEETADQDIGAFLHTCICRDLRVPRR